MWCMNDARAPDDAIRDGMHTVLSVLIDACVQ